MTMAATQLDVLKEAKRVLEKGEIESHDREELLSLLGILITALEKMGGNDAESGNSPPTGIEHPSSRVMLSMLKQQSAELDILRKLSLNLTSSLDMPTVLEAIVQEAMRLVNDCRNVHIFLYRNDILEFGAALKSDGSTSMYSTPRQDGLTYSVARSGKRRIIEDMLKHPLYKGMPEDWGGSILSIPLKMNNTVVGVMNLSRFTIGSFQTSELRLLNLLADQAAIAISNAMLHQQVSRKAYSDTVTGLPNRRALDARLEQEMLMARRTGQPFSIIMMDLDSFKRVNDTYGHAVGDLVLRSFFNYMGLGLRASDFLARYGGDELTLIMNQTNLGSAVLVAKKIAEKIEKYHFEAPDGKRITLSVSGGIAAHPDHGRTTTELMHAADDALYQAKRHNRGGFLVAGSMSSPLSHPTARI